jgi:putative tricarboxylic transport membrane protein
VDTSSNATLGPSVTTTLALGIPGDSVMAVMIGSLIIWGIQPGPALFSTRPDLVFTIAGIMLLATAVALGLSLLRLRGAARLLELPPRYLWVVVLAACMVGTYAINSNVIDVAVMLGFGVLGVIMRQFGFPAGPLVLGLILGELAEANLRRALEIGGPANILTSPIAVGILLLSLAAVLGPPLVRRLRRARAPLAPDSPLDPIRKDSSA